MEVIFSVSCASISVTQEIDVPVKVLHVLPAEWSTMKCLAHILKQEKPQFVLSVVLKVKMSETFVVSVTCCAFVEIFGWNVKASLNDALAEWEQKAFTPIHSFFNSLWTIISRWNHYYSCLRLCVMPAIVIKSTIDFSWTAPPPPQRETIEISWIHTWYNRPVQCFSELRW